MPKLIQLKVFRELRWLARPAKKKPEKLYFFASKDGKTVPLISHGQSSYWTAKSSFLFLASDHTEADPNYALGVDFWTVIFL